MRQVEAEPGSRLPVLHSPVLLPALGPVRLAQEAPCATVLRTATLMIHGERMGGFRRGGLGLGWRPGSLGYTSEPTYVAEPNSGVSPRRGSEQETEGADGRQRPRLRARCLAGELLSRAPLRDHGRSADAHRDESGARGPCRDAGEVQLAPPDGRGDGAARRRLAPEGRLWGTARGLRLPPDPGLWLQGPYCTLLGPGGMETAGGGIQPGILH